MLLMSIEGVRRNFQVSSAYIYTITLYLLHTGIQHLTLLVFVVQSNATCQSLAPTKSHYPA
jgi:hypothetical protein